MGKIVLITGCSSGLGLAIAVNSAARGHTVYATMRDMTKKGALNAAADQANVVINVRQLDVRDTDSINAVVDEIIATHGRIDALVNNAGMGFIKTTEQASDDELTEVIDINLLGVMRCTRAVLPHMRRQRAGHIVAVSSIGGLVGQPFNEVYCASKFGIEGYIEALATYVGPAFGLNFTVIEPGGIASEFVNNVMANLEGSGGLPQDDYLPLFAQYRAAMGKANWNHTPYQTADQAAQVVLEVLEQDAAPVRRRTSPWAEEVGMLKTSADPDGTALRDMVKSKFFGMD